MSRVLSEDRDDLFVREKPSDQRAIDLFRGKWTSSFPAAMGNLRAGNTPLFEDPRIDWACSVLGGFRGKHVLELGPLEGGHSYMLERAGAASILSIEANAAAYLRCLITKEIAELRVARFMCGDFVEYLRTTPDHFDLCLASGVLYHLVEPVEAIRLMAASASALVLWTHYYDEAVIVGNPAIAKKFAGHSSAELDGLGHTLYRYQYGEALEWDGFSGGSASFSHWLSREDIFASLRHFGFDELSINFDELNHPNGPALAIVARRSG